MEGMCGGPDIFPSLFVILKFVHLFRLTSSIQSSDPSVTFTTGDPKKRAVAPLPTILPPPAASPSTLSKTWRRWKRTTTRETRRSLLHLQARQPQTRPLGATFPTAGSIKLISPRKEGRWNMNHFLILSHKLILFSRSCSFASSPFLTLIHTQTHSHWQHFPHDKACGRAWRAYEPYWTSFLPWCLRWWRNQS